jgi:hypothetical protein
MDLKMKHIIDPQTNLVYTITTPNILQIVQLLEETIYNTNTVEQVGKNLQIALSLSKEIIQNEMVNQNPMRLEDVNKDSQS